VTLAPPDWAHGPLRHSSEPKHLADLLAPIIRLELASIGAIESATTHESHAGYVMLFHEAKTNKQASVEQMNTLLRLAGESQIESGGLIEPVLRLQTLGLQKASTTSLLGAMRLVENVLLDRYEAACNGLDGAEGEAAEVASRRARKRWMILTAHIAQRKDGESSHANELPNALSDYFASDEDRVCMRCLLDRPGAAPSLERQEPYTYICAACHAETAAEFPVDLQCQIPRWREQDLHDRVIHKAMGRPMKLKAVKEVHALLAGLPPDTPANVASTRRENPAAFAMDDHPPSLDDAQPGFDLSIPVDGASIEEASYTTLLFDYRSVRNNW
jgi:hypothetical protein